MDARYTSSEQALSIVAEEYPIRPVIDGRRSTWEGIQDILAALFFVAYTGFCASIVWEETGWTKWFFAVVSVGTIGYIFCRGCWEIADGCSLIRSRKAVRSEVGVYYRNGHYAKASTESDRRYGHRVTPVDRAAELASDGIDYAFVNGVIAVNVRDTVECCGSDVGDCRHYFEFDCVLDGEKVADGRWPSTKEASEEEARSIDGQALWVVGPVRGHGCVDIQRYWKAIPA